MMTPNQLSSLHSGGEIIRVLQWNVLSQCKHIKNLVILLVQKNCVTFKIFILTVR